MNSTLESRVSRAQLICFVVGVLTLALCAYGAFTQKRQFFYSYLAGWLFWMGLSTGSFLIAMIHQLTGGRWGYPTRRFLEAAFMVFPLMLLLFLPIYFGLGQLYPWARPAEVAAERVLQHRQGFEAPWAYIARTVAVLAIFIAMAAYLRSCSLRQDETADPAPTRRARFLSGPGLVLGGLLGTLAAVDWVMSLEKRWYSSIFAIVMLGGQVMVAYAFSILMLTLFRRTEPFAGIVNKTHYHQLGNLLLTFVMFWTYVAFGQLLIIYSGDLPAELDWYLHRIAGSWKWVVAALALFHFFVPFYLLLFRAVKLHVIPLAAIAGILFVAHAVQAYWLVMPSLHQKGVQLSWLDFAAPIGIGGIWLSYFLSRLKRAALVPRHDPGLQFAFTYAA